MADESKDRINHSDLRQRINDCRLRLRRTRAAQRRAEEERLLPERRTRMLEKSGEDEWTGDAVIAVAVLQ